MNELLVTELAKHISWDPSIKDPMKVEYSFDREAMSHVMKRHFKDTPYAAKFEEKAGDTLYKAMKGHPAGNLTAYAMGIITAETLLEIMDKPKNDVIERYQTFEDNAETFINHCRAFGEKAWEMRKAGLLDYAVDEKDFKYELEDMGIASALNKILSEQSLPPISNLLGAAKGIDDAVKAATKDLRSEQKRRKELEVDINDLQDKLRDYAVRAETMSGPMEIEEHDGTIPSGKVVYKKASEVFDVKMKQDFEVPFFEWDGVHPDVPKVDENYIFRPKELLRVLYGIATNQRVYLQGHTGSGKTTLVEQVAAALNYPFIRVNFDSEITRMDLIGRDTLTVEDGKTVSEFIDGILPRAMGSPAIFCADEIDFVRPDVAYVMQAALEGNGLRLTEDGDRVVKPHPMFRMFATGNTVGQGDEDGMYQGARPQSLAFLDRFTIWIKVAYLPKKDREALVKRHVPTLTLEDQRKLSLYMDEHIAAFESGRVQQPISPRGMLAIAKATVLIGDIREALEMTVLDKASGDDRSTLNGLIDRVA